MRQRRKAITACSDELESLLSGRTSETRKKGATLNYGRATGLHSTYITSGMPEKDLKLLPSVRTKNTDSRHFSYQRSMNFHS
jgi:hypothetical protein